MNDASLLACPMSSKPKCNCSLSSTGKLLTYSRSKCGWFESKRTIPNVPMFHVPSNHIAAIGHKVKKAIAGLCCYDVRHGHCLSQDL